MRFKVGDYVRLKTGWTKMVVTRIHRARITASYGNTASPSYGNRKTRHESEFVPWDDCEPHPSSPRYEKRTKTVKKYRTHLSLAVGEHVHTTKIGTMVLEFKNGDVRAYEPSDLQEVVPWTFECRAIGGNHRCHYEAPEGVRVNVGDVLLSDTGNIYSVQATDTQSDKVKKVFSGSRLVKESL